MQNNKNVSPSCLTNSRAHSRQSCQTSQKGQSMIKPTNQIIKATSSQSKQKLVKLESELKIQELGSKKKFHFDKNLIVQKKCSSTQKQKLFTIDLSKKIKTFENGWIDRQRLIQQKLLRQKENIRQISCSLEDYSGKIENYKQDSKDKLDYIKEEEDSYFNQIDQQFLQKQQKFQSDFFNLKEAQQNNEKQERFGEAHKIESLQQDNIFSQIQILKKHVQIQSHTDEKLKNQQNAIKEEQISDQDLSHQLNKIGQEESQIKCQILNKKQILCEKEQSVKTKKIKKQNKTENSNSTKSLRFIPVTLEKKYFSYRLLRQLFDLLKQKSVQKQNQNSKAINPYKKQFKYLSNVSSQQKLEQIQSIEDIIKHLQNQKPFIKRNQIVKVLRQFITQEDLQVKYLQQLQQIKF